MAEQLLSDEEIQNIIKASRERFLQFKGIMKFTKYVCDIYTLSPTHKLIFIKGDKDTGVEHINRRHRYNSNEYSPAKGGFIRTSRFGNVELSVRHYTSIADAVYSPNNIDHKNNRPDKFDVYTATLIPLDKTTTTSPRKYRLILYKDTKIVHTLFPVDEDKEIKRFKRGEIIRANPNPNPDTVNVLIPYYNKKKEIRYGIEFSFIPTQNIEEINILIFEKGIPTQKAQIRSIAMTYDFDPYWTIQGLNYVDFPTLEQFIIDTDDGKVKIG